MLNIIELKDWDSKILSNAPNNSFKLNGVQVGYNTKTCVKTIFPLSRPYSPGANDSIKTFNGFELEVSPKSGIIIIDVDFVNKQFNSAQDDCMYKLQKYLMSKPNFFYWEHSMNNGIHIIMCVANANVTIHTGEIINNTRRIEFKKTCLVAPTPNYRPGQLKIEPVCLLDMPAAYEEMDTICSIFMNNTKISTRIYLGLAPLQNKSACVKDKGALNEFLSSLYPTAHTSNYQSEACGNLEDEDVDMERVQASPTKKSGKRKAVGAPAMGAKKSRKRGQPQQSELFIECERAIDGIFDAGALPSDDPAFGGEDGEAPPVQLGVNDARILDLIRKIAENAQDTSLAGKSVAREVMNGLFMSLRSLIPYLKKQEYSYEINLYPVNVQFFLEIMMCADVNMANDTEQRFWAPRIDPADPNHSKWEKDSFAAGYLSIFSRLGNGNKWRNWTRAYLQLMDTMQVMNQRTGPLQEKEFDAYNLYRTITKLNVQGDNLSESEALAEFDSEFTTYVRDKIHIPRSTWSLFCEFILITLDSVHLNSIVVSQFKKYTDFCSDTHPGEMNLYHDIFEAIKLRGIRFTLNYMTEEGDRGKMMLVAVINFANYPWIKTNTDWFKAFISKCFPSMSMFKVDEFIEFMGARNRLTALSGKRVEFGHWTNCLPFLNGIMDMEMFFHLIEEYTQEEEETMRLESIVGKSTNPSIRPDAPQLPAPKMVSLTSTSTKRRFKFKTLDEELLNKGQFSINDFSRKHGELSSADIPAAFSFDSMLEYIKIVLTLRKKNGLRLAHKTEAELEAASEVSAAEVLAYLRQVCSYLENEHNLHISPEHFSRYKYFSIFRNYLPSDVVLTPLEKRFSIAEYLETFFSTNILSLDNYARYSQEFCIYARTLFGSSAEDGLMGPFQYSRLLVTMLILAQGMMRTKLFQVSLNLIGTGSNGKSFFMWMLKKCLGDKMANMQSKVMYGNTSETNQQAVGLEEAFFVYDQDADVVELAEFKKAVADIEGVLKRRLYKGLDRTRLNYATPILCSNLPLRYKRPFDDKKEHYEYAYHRRLVCVPFYNLLGKPSHDKSAISKLFASYDNFAACDTNMERKFEEFEQDAARNHKKESEDRKSLFGKHGFNLNNRQALLNIQLGMFWYILDTAHVFHLGNLSATNNDYVTASLAAQRQLGQANYFYLRLLLEHYFCLDQFETDASVIYSAERVDLAEFYSTKAPKSFRPEMLPGICEILRTCFDIFIEINHNSDYDSIMQPNTGEIISFSENQQCMYFARGLIPKNQLTAEQSEKVRKQPYIDLRKEERRQSDRADVLFSIPIGHRYGFGDCIDDQMYTVISRLCRGEKVEANMCPLVTSTWRNTTVTDLLTTAFD